jgi:hypothetical protein
LTIFCKYNSFYISANVFLKIANGSFSKERRRDLNYFETDYIYGAQVSGENVLETSEANV